MFKEIKVGDTVRIVGSVDNARFKVLDLIVGKQWLTGVPRDFALVSECGKSATYAFPTNMLLREQRKEESLPSYFEEERMLAEMAEACRLRGVAIDRREPGELGGYWGNR